MQNRDIKQYVKEYLSNSYDFEKNMVVFRRNKVLEILQKYKPKNILEIGCGMDSIFNYYKNYQQGCIVEPSYEFCFKAQEDLRNLNIRFHNDFVENKIEFLKEKNFDFIILSSLLHEVKNPKEFLQNILTICNKDTILHMNVPNAKSFHLLWAYESGLIREIGSLSERAKKLQQNSTFTLESLENFVNECMGGGKIELLDKGSYFIKPFNHIKMVSCLKENIIDAILLKGLDKMIKYIPEFGAEIFINVKRLD